MGNCCQSFIKYFIFTFNLVFGAFGLAWYGLGIYHYTLSNEDALISYIVIGTIMFITSFFGCYGSLSRDKCMINTFATILLAISLAEVFFALCIYDAIYELPHDMKADMVNYGINDTDTNDWDVLQQKWTCCGVIDYEDWRTNLPPSNSTASSPDLNVPASCCDVPPCNATNVYLEGCFDKKGRALTIMATVTIAIALFQLIFVICSCMIDTRRRKRGDDDFIIEEGD